MKIDCLLDYKTILNNLAQPVHLLIKLAAERTETPRTTPLAFCVVLDRSGSMAGAALYNAIKACELIIRNMREQDMFSLVIFDDNSRVLIPLQQVKSKDALIQTVRDIEPGGNTNLTSGWMLGRDELKKAPEGTRRRLLLLSDGLLNVGITEPEKVSAIVGKGLELDKIRTSCLGFGDHYEALLLSDLAKISGGDFYDADSPEKLPIIFKEELEGLQKISAQNVRLRLSKESFCEEWGQLSNYPVTPHPDGQVELTVGDLVSEEERALVLILEVLPLPLLGGIPVASLEGEKLLKIEVLWDEMGEQAITSCRSEQLIRIQQSQNPEDVQQNEEVVSWVAVQSYGKALEEATKEANANRFEEAKQKIKDTITLLEKYKLDEKGTQSLESLKSMLNRLELGGGLSLRDSRSSLYAAGFNRKSSSKKSWTGKAASAPAFSTIKSVEQQLEEDKTKPKDTL